MTERWDGWPDDGSADDDTADLGGGYGDPSDSDGGLSGDGGYPDPDGSYDPDLDGAGYLDDPGADGTGEPDDLAEPGLDDLADGAELDGDGWETGGLGENLGPADGQPAPGTTGFGPAGDHTLWAGAEHDEPAGGYPGFGAAHDDGGDTGAAGFGPAGDHTGRAVWAGHSPDGPGGDTGPADPDGTAGGWPYPDAGPGPDGAGDATWDTPTGMEVPVGADPDTGPDAFGPFGDGNPFPDLLGWLPQLPEPVDGFPWVDVDLLGGDLLDAVLPHGGPFDDAIPDDPVAAAHGAPTVQDLYAYAGEEPSGVDGWADLLASPDPAVSALARFWSEGA